MHGIATLAENIAAGKLRSGMATALGWFMHKYAAGIYSAVPRDVDLSVGDREDLAEPLLGGGGDQLVGVGCHPPAEQLAEW